MAGGNINYVHLLEGGTAEEFLRQREADVLGADPITAYVRSVQSCAAACGSPTPPSTRGISHGPSVKGQ